MLGDAHRLDRFSKLLSDTYWTDINAHGIVHSASAPVTVSTVSAGHERPSVQHILALPDSAWQPVEVGSHSIGPSWTTHWFRLTSTVPQGWRQLPVVLQWCVDALRHPCAAARPHAQ